MRAKAAYKHSHFTYTNDCTALHTVHMQVDEATLSDDVWSWMPPIERLHTWLWISEEKRDEIAEFAVRVLHEAADLL